MRSASTLKFVMNVLALYRNNKLNYFYAKSEDKRVLDFGKYLFYLCLVKSFLELVTELDSLRHFNLRLFFKRLFD